MSDHKSATPDIDTQIESLLEPIFDELLSNREAVTWEYSTNIEADLVADKELTTKEKQEAHKAIKTLLIQSKIDELERLIHPGWSGKIPENAATMLISHHDVEKQLAKLKEELEP